MQDNKNDIKVIHKLFIADLKAVAKDLGIPDSEVTKTQYFSKMELNEWQIRKAGGFTNLKKMYFHPEDNLETKYGSRMVSQHLNKIEKQYGQALFFEKQLLEAVRDILKDNPLLVHAPLKTVKKQAKAKRTIVAAISDTHFGVNVSKEEMHGLNEFNWTIAARRLALFMEQIVCYKPDHRKDTDLLLQLNGDILAGQIHNQEWHVDLLTTQFTGALNILLQAISYVAQHFHKVTVICTPGNHGRNVGKADKGRATVQKWDSYENMLYASLREVLKEKHKNIEFVIPESPFLIYRVQGHLVCQTHGDTVISVGNVGNSLNMNSINNQINTINASSLVKGDERIEVISVGHVHVPTVQILQNGGTLVINGCLSGTDPFAQSIGIFSNNPTQVLYESTQKHAVGDIRMIKVKDADTEERFDNIIKPFQRNY